MIFSYTFTSGVIYDDGVEALCFVTGRRKVSFGSFRSNSELTRGIPVRRLVVSAVIGEGFSSIVAALLAGGRIGRACDGRWYNMCRDALCERYNC